MTKTFTQDDIIRYLYTDNTIEDRSEFEQALICDNQLLDEYHQLRAVIKEIGKIKLEPSQNVVDYILNYSKSLNSHSLKNE